jgi:hypothetical protein
MVFRPLDAARDQDSLEKYLVSLRARCEKRPSTRLTQMIEQLESVIANRAAPKRRGAD